MHLAPQPQPRTQLLIVLAALAVSIAFWSSPAMYPIKLFVVMLHEISHGLAALATGGAIDHIEVSEQIGGSCVTRGGWEWLVVSSGYIGSMVFGGAILLLAQRGRASRMLAVLIGVLLIGVSVLFVRNSFGFVFGTAAGAVLLAAARWVPMRVLAPAMQYLGAASCLYALVDVQEDLLTLEHRTTDASILAGMTGIPAIVWGVLWSLAALVVFILILRRAWRTTRA